MFHFPPFIANMLGDIKKESEEKFYGFNDNYYVFGGLAPYHYAHFHKHFKSIFKNLRIHDLRHSYASYLNNKGIDIYLVKEFAMMILNRLQTLTVIYMLSVNIKQ